MAVEFFKDAQFDRTAVVGPMASVHRKGILSLNAALVDIIGKNWKYGLLGCDRDANTLLVKLTQDGAVPGVHCLKIAQGKNKRPAINISCRRYLAWTRLDYKEGLRALPAVYDESKKLITVQL